jgi:transposase
MADIAEKTKRYPSDLTDEEWERIASLLPRPAKKGRKPEVDLREVLNAIRYMARSGGGWRMLPRDFPPWQTVYWWFRRFVRQLLFRTIHDVALMIDRERSGRNASPTAGVIDSQTVKAPAAKKRGYDAAKKIVGRKRGIVTDTLGLILAVIVTAASLSENAVGVQLLDHVTSTYPTISKSWVDTGFKNTVIEHGASLGVDVEVVSRDAERRGFHVVKRRWVVERSLGWIMLHRRLSRDYETLPASSEAMIHIASIDNLTKRITDETTPTWRGTY